MKSSITIAGIDQAISNLRYRNPLAIKYRVVHAIRQFYASEDAIAELKGIDSDTLIKMIWDSGDRPADVQSKRRNLSSIRSSINADLKKLYNDGLNPEGIIITPSNVFDMSETAKNRLLDSFSNALKLDDSVSLSQIADVLQAIGNFLSEQKSSATHTGEESDKIKEVLKNLSQTLLSDEDGHEEAKCFGGKSESNTINEDTISNCSTATEDEGDSAKTADHGSGTENADSPPDDEADIVPVEIDDDELLDNELVEVDEDDPLEIDEDESLQDDDIPGEESDDDELLEDELVEVDEEEMADELQEINSVQNETGADDESFESHGGTDGPEASPPGDDIPTNDNAPEAAEDIDDDDILIEEIDDDELLEIDEDDPLLEIETEPEESEDDEPEIVELDDDELLEDELVEIDEDDPLLEIETEPEESGDDEPEIVELDDDELLEDELVEVDEDDPLKIDDEKIDIDDESLQEDDIPVEEIDDEELLEDELVEVDEEELEEEVVDDHIVESENGTDDNNPDTLGGLPFDNYGSDDFHVESKQSDHEKNRILAERFDSYLGSMDRYYNQYLKIPSGKYIIGTKNPSKDELLKQYVTLPGYYIGKFPVTNALFEIFVERTGYKTTSEEVGYGTVYYGRFKKIVDKSTGCCQSVWNAASGYEVIKGACWYQPNGPGSTLHNKRNHPVVQVSIKDAAAFAAWVGKRLPTEFEWEAAARTPKGYYFPWGNQWQKKLCNNESSELSDTTPVDYFAEAGNGFGLFDILGNVMEWTADECRPQLISDSTLPYFVAKGGSWISDERVRLFSRSTLKHDYTANILGFRCVADG